MRGIGSILVLLSLISFGSAQTISGANYSSAYANQTINATLAYIDSVNQSGYLIFYPHLSRAYDYIGEAQRVYKSSPDSAVMFAGLAMSSAQQEYSRISAYRDAAFAVMSALALASLALLYLVMRRIRAARSAK